MNFVKSAKVVGQLTAKSFDFWFPAYASCSASPLGADVSGTDPNLLASLQCIWVIGLISTVVVRKEGVEYRLSKNLSVSMDRGFLGI